MFVGLSLFRAFLFLCGLLLVKSCEVTRSVRRSSPIGAAAAKRGAAARLGLAARLGRGAMTGDGNIMAILIQLQHLYSIYIIIITTIIIIVS